MLFDGVSTLVLGGADAAAGTIDAAGGSLSAGEVTLTIPAGALQEGTPITMTPIADLADSPLAGTLVGGVKLEPEGLRFLRPTLLTMALPAGVPPANVLGFGSAGDGSDLHAAPHRLAGGTITLDVWHFSTAGASSGGAAAAAAMIAYTPSSIQAQAEQTIAMYLRQGPPAPVNDPFIITILQSWFGQAVKPGLLAAFSRDQTTFERAVAEWQAWDSYVRSYNAMSGLAAERAEAEQLATDDAVELAGILLARCTGFVDPRPGVRDLARAGSVIDLLGLAIEGTVTRGRALPQGARLSHACAHVEIRTVTHAPALALSQLNSFEADVVVAFWNGPDRTDMPIRLQLVDTTSGAPPTGSDVLLSETVTSGRLDTTIRPVGGGFRTMHLSAESTDAVLAPLGDRRGLSVTVRDRLEVLGKGPSDSAFTDSPAALKPGESVTVRVRVAGDGMVGASVTFALTGPGTLGATAGTTDAQGEAQFTYAAPTTQGNATATVRATFDGASDSIALSIKPGVTVTVSPTSVTLAPGQTSRFAATVANATDPSVGWGASGGTIDQSGLYTAGSAVGTFAVSAVSVEDPSAAGFATVTIVASTLPGIYEGFTCCGGRAVEGFVTITQPLHDGSFLLTMHLSELTCGGGSPWIVHATGSSFSGVLVGTCALGRLDWKIEGTVSGGVLSFTITGFGGEISASFVGMRRA